MKILHFTEEFPKISESFISSLITNMSEHDNLLLTNVILDDAYNLSFPVIDVKYNPLIRTFLKAIRQLFNVNISTIKTHLLLSQYNSFKPDCIHIHFGWSIRDAWPLLLSALKSNKRIPIIVSFHGSDVFNTPIKYPYYIKLINSLSKYSNVSFITPSLFLKNALLNILDNKTADVHIIGNIFNPNFLHSPNSFPSEPYRILSIGRLIPLKGHKVLIYAFSDFLKNSSANAHLNIIGDGPEKYNLLSLIEKLGLSSRVTLTGPLNHSEIPEYLFSSNLFIQPSITNEDTGAAESFGITILEAIAASLPVIVTDSGGMKEITQNFCFPTSYTAKENNVTDLSNAIEKFHSVNQPIPEQIKSSMLIKYSNDFILSKYDQLYK